MGPHTLRPRETSFSHWFYKGPRAEPRVPSWGIQQHHLFLGDAALRGLLVFPMLLAIPGSPCWAAYFLAQRD